MRYPMSIIPLVDIQKVFSPFRIAVNRSADIDIRPAIIVDVHYRHTFTPLTRTIHSRSSRHILKPEIPFVQIKLIRHQVTGEIYVLQAILVEIPDAYPTSIIHIDHIRSIDRIILYNGIVEMYARLRGRQGHKQRLLSGTGNQHKQKSTTSY